MSNATKTAAATKTLYQAEAHGPGMLCSTWRYNRGHGVTRETISQLVREWMARDLDNGGIPFHMVRITCGGEIVAESHRAADGEWYTTKGKITGLRAREEKWPPMSERERAAFEVALAAYRAATGTEQERLAASQAAHDAALAA